MQSLGQRDGKVGKRTENWGGREKETTKNVGGVQIDRRVSTNVSKTDSLEEGGKNGGNKTT